MSILLDALRKSERSQQPAAAPTIHTQQHMPVETDGVKSGPLVILLVLAMSLLSWIVWRQYDVPDAGYRPPVPLPAGREAADTTAVSHTPTDNDSSVVQQKTADSTQRRTPVESYEPSAAEKNRALSQTAPTRPADPAPVDQQTGLNRDVPAQPRANTDLVEQRRSDMLPQPISYWELPDELRTEVPEIKFSVLVYAAEPANRFVLVNGTRLVEGDEIDSGPVVEEIRRDGVVFSYRLYQFLVER